METENVGTAQEAPREVFPGHQGHGEAQGPAWALQEGFLHMPQGCV